MLIRTALLSVLLIAPAFAEDLAASDTSFTDVRLDHNDWSSGFNNAAAADNDDSFPRLQIEKSMGNDDDSDYQTSDE